MKTFLAAVGLSLVLAFIVFSFDGIQTAEAATPRTRAIEHQSPELFKNLHVQPRCDMSWDFGALTQQTIGQITCEETNACVSTGTRVGDACIVSSVLGNDGGAVLPVEALLSCRAGTDAVYVKLCALYTDGGTLNIGDAGYITRTIK